MYETDKLNTGNFTKVSEIQFSGKTGALKAYRYLSVYCKYTY